MMPDLLTQLSMIFGILLFVAGIVATLLTILVCVVVTIVLTVLVAYILIKGTRDWVRMSKVRKDMVKREEEKWKNEKDARITQLHPAGSKRDV